MRERDAVIASLQATNASLQAANKALMNELEAAKNKNSVLESSLKNLGAEHETLKRRLFGAKSERTNTSDRSREAGSIVHHLPQKATPKDRPDS